MTKKFTINRAVKCILYMIMQNFLKNVLYFWSYSYIKIQFIAPLLVNISSPSLNPIYFNPAAAGPPRHPPAAALGGHKVAPLYFCDDIVAMRRDREAKLCTHLSEYLAEVVFKFGVDPI